MGIFSAFNIFALWASRKPSNISKTRKSSFAIALVIPCFNEESVIRQKLENSIEALAFNEKSNIYIVDDSSTDSTAKLVEEYQIFHNVPNLFFWRNQAGRGKPKALNWIFSKLSEDITVITDADALLEKNSIAELVSNFGDGRVGAVTGKIVTRGQSDFTQKEEGLYRRISELWRRAESNLDSCSIFNGPLMAFRTELSQHFKIDERIEADDTDLAFKIRRLGYRAVFEPNAVVTEQINSSMKVRAKQEIRRARGLSRALLNNAGVLGKYGYFGKVIYPFSVFNYLVSPILTLILLFILPFVIVKYAILLSLLLFLVIPTVRTAIFGYLYRQIALVIGLITPSRGQWTPNRIK